ncbi:MAG TPA: hypothetical protein VGO67_05225 [Verrucomicrobiae bacterium]
MLSPNHSGYHDFQVLQAQPLPIPVVLATCAASASSDPQDLRTELPSSARISKNTIIAFICPTDFYAAPFVAIVGCMARPPPPLAAPLHRLHSCERRVQPTTDQPVRLGSD